MSCECWTDKDKATLLAFKKSIDCDDIKVKEQIKKVLLTNKYIVHVLNNKELEENEAEPDDYFGINIRPYFMIPETQSDTKNFLCYEVNYKKLDNYNPTVKLQQVIFYIVCHQEDIIDKETGLSRHDLLAALVIDQFNYTTYIGGGRLKLVSDMASVTDMHYATRTLTFEQRTDNNMVKSKKVNDQYIPFFANKEIQYLE